MDRDPRWDSHEPSSDDVQEGLAPGMPRCPNCGWQDVRISHLKGAFDSLLRKFSCLPFRCRSCGARFRRFHRRPAEES
jgi:hypothetical protein